MLETLGLFALIGLILWGLFWLTRWGDRVAQRSAVRLAKRLTDASLSRWWLRNGSQPRGTFVWRRAVLECVIWCVVWLVFGLLFGKTVLPGGVLLYWIWRRAGHTWDANVAECGRRGLATPVAAIPVVASADPRTSDVGVTTAAQDLYFIHAQNETEGPFTRDQLESMWNAGAVTADTLFWQDTAQAWLLLRDLIRPVPAVAPAVDLPVSGGSRRWTWREWTTVAFLLPLALLVWGAAYASYSSSSAPRGETAPPVVAPPSAMPAPPAADTNTQPGSTLGENQQRYMALTRALYPDVTRAHSALFDATNAEYAAWSARKEPALYDDAGALLMTLAAARQIGINYTAFGSPTAPVGSPLQILAITKPSSSNSHASIRAFFGLNPDGTGWELFSPNAVNVVLSRTFSFYVDRGGRRANVVVVDNHLQTVADGMAADNLLSLPNLAE